MTAERPAPPRQPTAVERVARIVATWFGVGYAPVAPGTFGTAAAVPLAYLMASWPTWGYAAAVAGGVGVAIVAAGLADESFGGHDTQHIVVDEVVGYLATVALVPRDDWRWLLAGFVVFRALDITKPPPIRWFDRHLRGGAGVVLDDVVAGLIGGALLAGARVLLER